MKGYRLSRQESWTNNQVTELSFADDIALFSDQFQQAQELLKRQIRLVFYQMQLRIQNTCSLTIMFRDDPMRKTRDDRV